VKSSESAIGGARLRAAMPETSQGGVAVSSAPKENSRCVRGSRKLTLFGSGDGEMGLADASNDIRPDQAAPTAIRQSASSAARSASSK
jgi:hypothetical protein